jgi:predicted HTH transcriptional regulator
MPLSERDVRDLIAASHEFRGIEVKGPGALSHRDLRIQVFKAMLGLANRRDGGFVLVGIADRDTHLELVGLDAADVETWTHDAVAGKLRPHVDPFIDFDVYRVVVDGLVVLVIEIREFEEIPVLCLQALVRLDGKQIVRRGALLVRSAGKHETSEVPTQTEMRELLALMTEKGVRRFLQTAERVGMPLQPQADPFAAERGDDL